MNFIVYKDENNGGLIKINQEQSRLILGKQKGEDRAMLMKEDKS